VATLVIPIRKLCGLEEFITVKHLDNMAKLMLFTSLFVSYGYLSEWFVAWYSGNAYDWNTALDHLFGPYAPIYVVLVVCNCLAPLIFFWPTARRSASVVLVISLLINVGMWAERFIIVVQSLSHDFLPSPSRVYWPTIWDWGIFLGTFGIFSTGMLLFIRFLPMMSICELSKAAEEEHHEG
jgi:molybdopterin-containing oxidoreductase family membrane subunit